MVMKNTEKLPVSDTNNINIREESILWWNDLKSDEKTTLIHVLGFPPRTPESLTGREIEIIYRRKMIEDMENSFLMELRNNGLEISDDAVCTIEDFRIELGIKNDFISGFKIAHGSSIDLYPKPYKENLGLGRGENEINFGTSGSFTPSNKKSYWRTIHAASILKNWILVSDMVNKYCKMVSQLY